MVGVHHETLVRTTSSPAVLAQDTADRAPRPRRRLGRGLIGGGGLSKGRFAPAGASVGSSMSALPASVRSTVLAMIAIAALVAACGTSHGSSAPASSAGSNPSAAPPASVGAGALGLAQALQDTYVSVVARVNPSVVVIETSQGLGSGVVFDNRGDIVTNAHVAGTSTSFTVTVADGRRLPGTLVGTFPPDDVAVIRVSGGKLTPATFGVSSRLKVGDIVLAIGNPLGLQSSVTNGIVSATGRTVVEPGGSSIPNMIQTSAPINPGNSGGALVDLAGEVIGIPTLAASDPQMGGSAPGIGFAVSSDMATDIARQLIANGKVVNSHRAYLGVQLANAQQAPGALVAAVQPDGPAGRAGVVPGDLIVAIDGKTVDSPETLSVILASIQPGTAITVTLVAQDGSRRDVKVTVGSYPG